MSIVDDKAEHAHHVAITRAITSAVAVGAAAMLGVVCAYQVINGSGTLSALPNTTHTFSGGIIIRRVLTERVPVVPLRSEETTPLVYRHAPYARPAIPSCIDLSGTKQRLRQCNI